MGIDARWTVQVGTFPTSPFLPMVHWDGMDTGDLCMVEGASWDIPNLSLLTCADGEWCKFGCSQPVTFAYAIHMCEESECYLFDLSELHAGYF